MSVVLQNLSFRSSVPISSNNKNSQNEQIPITVKNSVKDSSLGLVDKNYNRLMVSKKSINFGANLPALALNHKIANKLSAALQGMRDDDIILVGKNLKELQDKMKNSLPLINKVIKKFLLIEEPQLNASFAIIRNNNFDRIVNINKKPLVLHTKGNEMVALKTNESHLIYEGNKIATDGMLIPYSYESNQNLSAARKLHVKEFDFSKEDMGAIITLNTKRIEKLAPPEEAVAVRKIMFADVGGQDKAIDDLKKAIVYPLKFPSAYKNNIVNRGSILTGGPGTGKTLLAEATANETNAHFIQLNGLEMESKWAGESEENWRKLFAEAKEFQPTIIFIDEFDGVAKKREGSSTSRYDDKIVNQLLSLMSDTEKGKFGNVFVIAATNKLHLLDDAISRSGRFGKYISVEKPDLKGCKHILNIHSKNKPVSEKFDFDEFAKKLHNAKTSGADIAQIVNDSNIKTYERLGVFEKMEAGTFEDKDLIGVEILPEDFEKALNDFVEQSKLKLDPETANKIPMGLGR